MNAYGDLWFAPHMEYAPKEATFANLMKKTAQTYMSEKDARKAAFAPGGLLSAGILSERSVACIFGRTLFVHGCFFSLQFREGAPDVLLDSVNSFARRWLRGDASAVNAALRCVRDEAIAINVDDSDLQEFRLLSNIVWGHCDNGYSDDGHGNKRVGPDTSVRQRTSCVARC
eukprot:m.11931 g.11931  ORF g.11931 m.11931 type:complete len:172 (-) comp2891_c0_seq1:558-1073(-)